MSISVLIGLSPVLPEGYLTVGLFVCHLVLLRYISYFLLLAYSFMICSKEGPVKICSLNDEVPFSLFHRKC